VREEYVAYRGVTARERLELTARQRTHLRSLVDRYTTPTATSKAHTAQYRPVFATPRNIAGFRPEWKEMIYQIIAGPGAGAHFTDLDGRDYLDISMGFGVYLFGHNPPFVQAALQREVARGTPIGPMSAQAGEVAALIRELTGVERVAFFNTGTEADMAALRIARTVTGRRKVVLFATSYHGHFDGVLGVKAYGGPVGQAAPMSPGTPPEMVQDLYVLDYGSEEALQFIEAHGRELAAVLVEPVQSRRPELQPGPFLKRLRELTAAAGAALIFDEVILGFRIHPGGAQAWFDVRADLVVYGKVVGGGLPIGVVAGAARYLDAVDGGMWQYGDASFPERENTFIAGTFNHHPLAMASAEAVLRHLKEAGPALQAGLNRRTEELGRRLNVLFEEEGVPLRMVSFGSLFRIPVRGDQELLYYHLLARGIYIWEGRNCFLSTAHTDADCDRLVGAVRESLAEMRAGGLFPPGRAGGASEGGGPPERVPLASAQRRIYALSQLEGGELSYHTPVACFLDGDIEPAALERHLQALIARHEALRTGFAVADGEPRQWVETACAFTIERREVMEEGVAALAEAFIRPFDLARPPLVRCCLARIAARRFLFLLDTHHCVFDGISTDILMGELLRLWGGQPLPPLAARYRDYVAREQAYLASPACTADEAFWVAALGGDPPPLRLPTDRPRPGRRTFRGDRICRVIDRAGTEALRGCAGRCGASLFMTLFAAYVAWLHKLTGQEDITVGTTYDARAEAAFQPVVGMFVNTVAVRSRPEPGKRFRAFLDEVKRGVLEAFDRQAYPFERLVERLRPRRDAGRNPLFDTLFVYEPVATDTATAGGVTLTKYDLRPRTAIFDLSLEILEIAGTLHLTLEYSTDLFDSETVGRFLGQYAGILDAIAAEPAVPLASLSLLGAAERRLVVEQFNATAAAYPETKPLAALFEEQAARTPERTALVCADRRLSYRALNGLANGVAARLRAGRTLEPGTLVGVALERSERWIAAVLGILKAGGAWLPIERRTPAARVRHMLEESGCRLVATDGTASEALGDLPPGTKTLDLQGVSEAPGADPEQASGPRDLAYAIYTSGSTGRPKGVLIEQRSVVNNVWGTEGYRDADLPKRVGLTTAAAFDPAVQEIFGALLFGHCLHVIPEETVEDGAALAEYICRERLELVDCTPTLFAALLEAGLLRRDDLALRQLLLGGEPLPWGLLDRATQDRAGRPLEVFNLYGPTECCIDATCYRATGSPAGGGGVVPIGRPKANMRIYILDGALAPVPIGVEGEICIAGCGLARGYVGQPALTAAAFVDLPWRPGERIYRSGDRGRWLADGTIAYLGRADDQVKVRGYRIECGEIEARLREHAGIADAAVVVAGAPGGDRELVAYVVAPAEMTARALREFLQERLPAYMLPARFVRLERLPVAASGKVDKRALADSRAKELAPGTAYVPPRGAPERALCAAWEAVLGCAGLVGIDDNFFDLGGDSIKALQIVARLGQEQWRVEVRQLFEAPTVRELAPRLAPAARVAEQGPIVGRVPLSAIQAWCFRTHGSGAAQVAQAVLLQARARIDAPALRQGLAALQEHHDALRMRYRREADGFVQEIGGTDCPLAVEEVDLRGRPDAAAEAGRRCGAVRAAMRLEGPMWRSLLLRRDEGDRLCLVIQHLVVDGVSWRVLLEDLETAYAQALAGQPIRLPPKTDAVTRWGAAVQHYSAGEALRSEIPFWRRLEAVAADQIPVDVAAGEGPAGSERLRAVLGEAESAALSSAAHRAWRAETQALLLVALGRALRERFGVRRSLLALEGHGREAIGGDLDVGRTVGWFTSVYPFLLEPGAGEVGEQIRKVKADLGGIPARGIGYGILEHVTPPARRDGLTFGLAPQILFNYLGVFDEAGDGHFALDAVGIDAADAMRADAHHPLEIEGAVLGGRLHLWLTYAAGSFRRETAQALLDAFAEELRRIGRAGAAVPPSDVALMELDVPGLTPEEVGEALEGCGLPPHAAKALYPLSPLQEGLLFHERLDADAGASVQQVCCHLVGRLDLPAFEAAWNALVVRHDILRTRFVHRGLERPLQVVARDGGLDFRREDIAGLPEAEQAAFVARDLARDRREGFRLSAAAPMRVTVLRQGPERHALVWTTHGLLLDGWSTGILAGELFAAYAALRAGREPALRPAAQYGDYIRWLEGRDRAASLAYWKEVLDGYAPSAGLPRGGPGNPRQPAVRRTAALALDRRATAQLRRLAAARRVTLNTVIQAAWAVLLCRHGGVEDVVFGATVSGRPGDLPGIEETAGLFINTIPVRVQVRPEQPFGDLLTGVQRAALRHEPHQYGSLADIQAATPLGRGRPDHVLVFENYPLASELGGLARRDRLGLSVEEVQVFERTSYGLTVQAELGETLRVEFQYDPEAFPDGEVDAIRATFAAILGAVGAGAEVRTGDLWLAGRSEAEQRERGAFLRAAAAIDEEF
jgi:amino acid adenylation domain-containing protein/non-ribosomal peptide synthase protein (TIGR01720 family)